MTKQSALKYSSITITSILIIIFAISFGAYNFYQAHFLPNTYIDGQNIGNLNLQEAISNLDIEQIDPYQEIILTFPNNDWQIASSAATLGLHRDFKSAAEYTLSRQNLSFINFWHYAFSRRSNEINTSSLNYDTVALNNFVMYGKLNNDATGSATHITLGTTNRSDTIAIVDGEDEITINQEATLAKILDNISQNTWKTTLVFDQVKHSLTEEKRDELLAQVNGVVGRRIEFETSGLSRNISSILNDVQLVALLGPESPEKNDVWQEFLSDIIGRIDRPTREPVFVMSGSTVTEFVPPINGVTVDTFTLEDILNPNCFLQDESGQSCPIYTLATADGDTIIMPVVTAYPRNSLADTNELGINERIGFGDSLYAGSPPGRVHNVAHTARILNNILVAPGEEFSFNRALGSVSAATGFQPGNIIRAGRTVLAYGGGVCQVSTTLFRALLDSGVNITLRLPHSYRVGFYEQGSPPGFDATVYAGSVDLRFINDTPGYILITMETDSARTYMSVSLYGTSDGRRTEIQNFRQWDERPPLPTVYIEDPELALGQRRQVDWAVTGLRTTFDNVVFDRDGNEIRRTSFPSNYRPWAAVFMVGTRH